MPRKSISRKGSGRRLSTLPREFETIEAARAKRELLIRRLQSLDNDDASALARILDACRAESRCGSGACAECNRVFRLRLAQEIRRVRPTAFEALQVSLIPQSFRVEVGGLAGFDLSRWMSSRQRALQRGLPAGALFVGGADISLNTFENADAHWCFHIYGYVLLPEGWGVHGRYKRRRVRAELERRCPPVPKAARFGAEKVLTIAAMDVQSFDEAILYSHKADFYRRSRYVYTKRKTGKSSTNVDPQTLSRGEALELSIFLARFPLGTRLFLLGFRRRGSRFDHFTLHRERELQSSQNDGSRGRVRLN